MRLATLKILRRLLLILHLLLLGELPPADRTDDSCASLLQSSPGIEAPNVSDHLGHLFARSTLTLDPGVAHDAIAVEALRRLYAQQLRDQILGTVGDIIPVGRWEFKGTLLD